MGPAFLDPHIFCLDEKLTHHDDEHCFSMILVDLILVEKLNLRQA